MIIREKKTKARGCEWQMVKNREVERENKGQSPWKTKDRAHHFLKGADLVEEKLESLALAYPKN